MNVENEFYESLNNVINDEDNEEFVVDNDIRENLTHNKNLVRKIRNKKSKTWDYFEDDGNSINCKVLVTNLGINCGAKYSRNSVSTSTLNYHLIHKHGIFINSQEQVCLTNEQ